MKSGKIAVPARQFEWDPSEMQPLPSAPVTEGVDTTIVLAPYSLIKFRVSMFPVTASAWNKQ